HGCGLQSLLGEQEITDLEYGDRHGKEREDDDPEFDKLSPAVLRRNEARNLARKSAKWSRRTPKHVSHPVEADPARTAVSSRVRFGPKRSALKVNYQFGSPVEF